MSQAALRYAQEHRTQTLDELKDLIRIPSVSTLPEHRADMLAAAQWLLAHCKTIGLEHVQLLKTQGHPCVYADWLHAPGKPTVLVYGHYDVQPVDPLNEWTSPPFEPTLRGENLVARGASDDKGQVFVHLKAVQALLNTDGKLPVNVKFLIEGEEEIGSAHLRPALEAHHTLLQADVCVISDGNILSPTQPLLVYGLRGLVYSEIEVQGPSADLHSGRYGGAVHNPMQALCEILAALHDGNGTVTIPGFYDRVRKLPADELQAMNQLPFSDRDFLQEMGAPALWGERQFSVLERVGARPTLEIHGIRGGFTGEGAKTVIPAKALAKVSMRLVANQSGAEIAKLYANHVQSIAPRTVKVQVRILQHADPALTERDHPATQAAARAYEASFGAKPCFMLEGGSIPVVEMLQKRFKLPVVLMGFGLPDDRLHSPNEKYHLPTFYKGIDCSIHFLQEMGKIGA
ncbi:MAG TPA: dipeptidase [Candidatus Bipolaricaulota bacterium]